nr:UDP-N-acetylmuramate dehydrogenase [Corynebacterium atrinae]
MYAHLQAIDSVTLDADATFADLTSLHVGGRPRLTVRCATDSAVAEVVMLLDALQMNFLIVGGGSNLIVADGELDLVAVVLENREISLTTEGVLRAGAGAVWDDVVLASVEAGFGGIECLSGIPGSAGATPVQNVGAYGAEISDVLVQVLLLDRTTGEMEWVPASSLELAYRYSNLKFSNRAVVLAIELQLSTDGLSGPLRYGELARRLGATEAGERHPVADVRAAVLELRHGKGMVIDPADHDTWSAGSFFTNPIVPVALADEVQARVREVRGAEDAERMPRFPAGGEHSAKVKLSAAWLIDRAGFGKGFPGEGAPARLSTKHTLALTNRGSATTADVVALAREVRDGVQAAFQVILVPEPVWVGVAID